MHHNRILLGDAHIERLDLAHHVVGQAPRRAHLAARDDCRPAIPPHRVSRHAQLARNRLRTPPAVRQLMDRGDDLSLDHRYLRCRRYQIPSLKLHSTLLRGSELMARRGQYHCRSTLFADVGTALFDSYVAVWDAKYEYNYWRPYTAIREAEVDDNPRTAADPNWEPLRTTPPFPEYVSAHATAPCRHAPSQAFGRPRWSASIRAYASAGTFGIPQRQASSSVTAS